MHEPDLLTLLAEGLFGFLKKPGSVSSEILKLEELAA